MERPIDAVDSETAPKWAGRDEWNEEDRAAMLVVAVAVVALLPMLVVAVAVRLAAPGLGLRIYERIVPERAWHFRVAGVLALALSAFSGYLAFSA